MFKTGGFSWTNPPHSLHQPLTLFGTASHTYPGPTFDISVWRIDPYPPSDSNEAIGRYGWQITSRPHVVDMELIEIGKISLNFGSTRWTPATHQSSWSWLRQLGFIIEWISLIERQSMIEFSLRIELIPPVIHYVKWVSLLRSVDRVMGSSKLSWGSTCQFFFSQRPVIYLFLSCPFQVLTVNLLTSR